MNVPSDSLTKIKLPQQVPLVRGPWVRLQDESGEQHSGRASGVHRIALRRSRRDRPQLLRVGEVEADPGGDYPSA